MLFLRRSCVMGALAKALLLACVVSVVEGRQNMTLDDSDSQVVYEGSWSRSSLSQNSLDYGGSYQFATDSSAKATFNFTGVAVYFLSPLWPRPVSTLIQLDDEPSVLLNLTDPSSSPSSNPSAPETVQSHAIWGKVSLADREHTLVISVGEGQASAIVDALMYTVQDSAESSPASSSSDRSAKQRTVAIAVGCVAGSVAIGLILGLFILCRRRQRNKKAERIAEWTSARSINGRGPTDSKTSSTTKLEPTHPPGAPNMPPMPYIDPSIPYNPNDPSNPYAATNLYQSLDPQQIAFLQTQYAQWAMHQYPHTHPRYTINTLSTITEANSPYSVNASLSMSGGSQYHTPASWGGSMSLGPHSPASLVAEFGHIGSGGAAGTGGSAGPGGMSGTGGTMETRESAGSAPAIHSR